MRKFIDDHFAVLVVLVVFMVMFGAYVLEVGFHENTGTIDWLEGELKEVIGALLMGLTGSRVTQVLRNTNGGSNGTSIPSSPTSVPTTPTN